MIHYEIWQNLQIKQIGQSLFKPIFAKKWFTSVVLLMMGFTLSASTSILEVAMAGIPLNSSFFTNEITNQRQIIGRVIDQHSNPLVGVTVTVKGTTMTVKTDGDGAYAISAKSDETLEFSFVGMKHQEILVGNQMTINVTMEEDAVGIDEVVVIGYGVQKRVSITNAVSSIGSEEISSRNSTNVTQALQGKLPGLTILDRGGAPGSESLTSRIRGVTSLNDNSPLVLIDGVPGSLSRVNPADIESVSVLKDAASTAIYGSRASAGVILVTTKAPSDGKLSISYDGYFGLARSNNIPKHMDAVT